MTAVALLGHNDGNGMPHQAAGSIWMMVSMVALSLFLLAFTWSLLRSAKRPAPTRADIATERFAQGEIDADEFERIVGDAGPRSR